MKKQNNNAVQDKIDLQALQESDARFHSIVVSSPDAIIITDAKGKIEYMNPAAEKVFNRKLECFMGEDFGLPLVNGESTEIDIFRPGKDPGVGDLYVTETEWLGEKAHLITIRDITGRKRAEEDLRKHRDHLEELVKERTKELEEANLRLQELDHLKSMFIASMSHELRTPLNSIIGFTGIILMGMSGEISAIQKKQLGMVKNSANHLLELINDVIDVSKIEAGKTDLSIEAFDLSDLVLEVKESFAIAAAEKGLKLEYGTDSGAEVISDRRRVKQILVNLVGNAVKFTETGTVMISILKTQKGVEIKVRDTGIGMYREDMERLFLAFSRIHIQGRPIVEGTGLGLYLSRRIAALLGGEITAESEPDQGSEFTLSLPLKYSEDKE